MDFKYYKKTDQAVFRQFLSNSRQNAFPRINDIYYKDRVDKICQTLDDLPSSNNTVILADIEIFDDICARINANGAHNDMAV